MVVVKDAAAWAEHLSRAHGIEIEQTVVIAHSVGAVVAAAWVHDFAPRIRGLVLATPALRVKLYVPFAVPALRFKQATIGGGTVKSYVKSKMLTRDPEQARLYDQDSAIFRQISVKLLLDLHDAGTRLIADAGAIRVPTLLIGAGRDWVVSLDAQKQFFERLSSPIKRMEVFAEMGHAVFHELGRERIVQAVSGFANDCFDRVTDRRTLDRADEGGYTRTEYDLLRSPGAMKWKVQRGFLGSIGKLSTGVRLGWQEGFDSGKTLDYVYRNQPAGQLGLGKVIDKNYLNAIGWRGIRVRGQNLQRMLQAAIEKTHAEGKPVHILDIAAGGGRYVLETVARLKQIPIRVTLRDYRQQNLDAATALAKELGLSDVTCLLADAFDRASLAATTPRPTIAIVSGLYELFPQNAPLRRSLAGLADALEPGATLLYTNQPWHPQVEMIARTLTNREGQPWIMRRRTQEEMDDLVRLAGFRKESQDLDEWGIFTVSRAIRVR
jgi:esterase/lipase